MKNTPVGLSLMNSIMNWLGLPEAAFFNCDGALAIMTTELKDRNLFFMGTFFCFHKSDLSPGCVKGNNEQRFPSALFLDQNVIVFQHPAVNHLPLINYN